MRWLLPMLCLGCASNRAPVFEPPPTDETVTVGQAIEFPIRAIDRDGDPVKYGARGLPQGSNFDARARPAIFRWVPLISDAAPTGRAFPITFVAQDDSGARVEARITITVFSGNSRPAFTSPGSAVLDLDLDDTFVFPVTVRDDDSEAVDFELIEAPEGASLEEVEAKSAILVWEPSPDQLARRRVYAFTLNVWDERPADFVQQKITLVVVGDASN